MLTKKDKSDLVREFSEIFVTKEEFRSGLIQFKDDILFEIKAMREEISIIVGYRQTIEEHDERITTLERR